MGYIVKPATFDGLHNKIKSKCFIVMYLHGGFMSCKELSEAAGEIQYCSRWHRYGYLMRRTRAGRKRSIYIYALTLRGKRFVTDRIPPEKYEEYLAEIKAHQAKQKE